MYGISHIGEKGPSAHLVAVCRSPVDGNLYRYNDDMVTPINGLQKDVEILAILISYFIKNKFKSNRYCYNEFY